MRRGRAVRIIDVDVGVGQPVISSIPETVVTQTFLSVNFPLTIEFSACGDHMSLQQWRHGHSWSFNHTGMALRKVAIMWRQQVRAECSLLFLSKTHIPCPKALFGNSAPQPPTPGYLVTPKHWPAKSPPKAKVWYVKLRNGPLVEEVSASLHS